MARSATGRIRRGEHDKSAVLSSERKRLGNLGCRLENPPDFGDPLRRVFGAVICRDDQFRLSTIQMRAPIRDDAITAVWRIAFATVADDRVIGNASGERK